MAQNPVNAVPAIKAAIRGYRASESSARDLILTVFKIMDDNLDHTASTINGLVDLLDEEDKKQDLLASWKGFNLEVCTLVLIPVNQLRLILYKKQRRNFPDLVPQSISGEYAGITSGRVLNAKHSTATRSSRPTRQVWDRVAAVASSSSALPRPRQYPSTPGQSQSSRFPPLPSAHPSSSSATNPVPGFRQPKRTTPWSASGSAAAGSRAVEPRSVPALPKVAKNDKPPKLDNDLFPELPASSTARERPQVSGNQSLKRILKSTGPTVSAWHPGNSSGNGDGGVETNADDEIGAEEGMGGKKGKKGKGKQKQMLFTLGSFPT